MAISLGAACSPVRRALDSYVSNELDAAQMRVVRQHLATCRACAALAAGRSHAKRLVRRAVRSETPGEGLRQRVRQLIRES